MSNKTSKLTHFTMIKLLIISLSIQLIYCDDLNVSNLSSSETTESTINNNLIPPVIDQVVTTTPFGTTTPKTFPVTIASLLTSKMQNSTITSNATSTNSTGKQTNAPAAAHSYKNEFVRIMDGLILVFSNLSLLPAVYIAIKGQFRAEAIVYTLTIIFSALYHLCDCDGLDYCFLPYDLLQFADFFCATLTLWCTTIIIANVPYGWISSFHLAGSIVYGTVLHFWMTGTWTFVIPGVCTLLLIGSFWGYRYYREHTLPELALSQNFYAACGLMAFGSIMFASQKMSYFQRFYGITHSLWHISMSLSVALLLPNYSNIESFWQDNLKIGAQTSDTNKSSILSLGKGNSNSSVTMINSKSLSSSTDKDINHFNAHINKGFNVSGPI